HVAGGVARTVPWPGGLQKQGVEWDMGVWFPDSTGCRTNAPPATEFWNEWSSADTSIWAVSLLGGAPTKIRDHAVVWSVSPDGSTISFGTNKDKRGEREIWLMGPNGEQARKFYEVNDDSAVCCFGLSPDGKRYAYISTDASGGTMLSRQVKGGSPITLFQDAELKKMDDIVWLPDGRVVYSLPEATGTANYWTTR